MNQDKRIERYRNDARFAILVNQMLHVMYSDSGYVYSDFLDAAFVARIKFEAENPDISYGFIKPQDKGEV